MFEVLVFVDPFISRDYILLREDGEASRALSPCGEVAQVKQPSEFRWHFRAGFEPRAMAESQLSDDLAQKRVGRIDVGST